MLRSMHTTLLKLKGSVVHRADKLRLFSTMLAHDNLYIPTAYVRPKIRSPEFSLRIDQERVMRLCCFWPM